jgi:hypothetical protein
MRSYNMSRWRRIYILPAVLALALGFMGLSGGLASAQYYSPYGNAATVNCPGWPSSVCTVTLNQYISPGQSVQVTLPDGQTVVTVNCTNGCFPNQTFSVTVTPSLLANGIQQYVTAGNCVNGSYATNYGCTSAYLSIPATNFGYATPTYSTPTYSTYYPPTYIQPPAFYPRTPTYVNGYWWQWSNNSWSWSHHGNNWHPWHGDRDDR